MKQHVNYNRTITLICVLVLLCIPAMVMAFDVDGDGKEGLPEAIHALQVSSGIIPSTPPTGDAQPEDVVKGHTFSNSEETGLTGTRYPAPIPKIGNLESELGVEWPSPRITGNAILGYVDNLTGLHWAPPENYSGVGGNYLNMDGYCDTLTMGLPPIVLNDWRVPNIRELLSLVDYSTMYPRLPIGHPFGLIDHAKAYWTSTTLPIIPAKLYSVNFADGTITAEDPVNTKLYVWCVRGNK